MSNYFYIEATEPQYVYPYTVPVFQARIEGPASRFQYIDPKVHKDKVSSKYFCDYTKFLPPIDRFATNLRPNCFFLATGPLICSNDKNDMTCFKKNLIAYQK